MPQQQPPPLTFSHDTALAEGDVALVFRKDGSLMIQHNVKSVRDTGKIVGGPEGAGFLMALGALEMVEDEAAFGNAMRRAALKLSGFNGPGITGKTN